MLVFDKLKIREALSDEDVFQLLHEWGGDPKRESFGFVSSTICHNRPGEGSHKLYYYSNTGLLKCYTGCDEIFDIYQLVIKVADIQWNQKLDLNGAIRWIANKFGISGEYEKSPEGEELSDWKILANYERIQEIEVKTSSVVLKNYEPEILQRFNYTARITPWLEEGISQEAIRLAQVGFYPGGDQITIPHFDKDSRFIGLRGRTLCDEEGQIYGKYRPLKINNILYNHPLGFNLYGLNWNKDNIKLMQKAIIFEAEKSVLKYASYFGIENNISVACCGSSLSNYQIQLLIEAGAKEIVISFDRQFQEIGDDEFKHLKNNLIKLNKKYKNDIVISFMFDKKMITPYKASPIDEGAEVFLKLFKERIIL